MNGARLWRIGLALALLAGVAGMLMQRGAFEAEVLEAWVRDTGAWGPLVFVMLGIAATVLWVPATVFVLAGGVLFGPWLGTLYSLVAASAGAAIAFLIARYIASEWVAGKSRGWLKRLIEGVEAEGWHFVAFVRLVPIFPFFLLNYALGLTRIPFSVYLSATFLCSIPGVAAFSYLGYAGREALGGGEQIVQKLLLALGLLAVTGFLPRLVRRLHRRVL